jgi:hypothetical protein
VIRRWYPSVLVLAAGAAELAALPLWARAAAFVPALVGVVVEHRRSESAEARVRVLEAENEVPLWLREQREQESIVSAFIVAQHPVGEDEPRRSRS